MYQTTTHRPRRHGRAPLARAFTLIELLLVLVILGVLAGIVVPRLVGRGEQAKIKAAGVDISGISTALEMYEKECGHFPSETEGGLQALVDAPAGLKGWNGPYLKGKSVPMDPWGTPYQYRAPGVHNDKDFDLWSFGPDKQDGGDDDIDNWTQNK